jgi:hypothetical protein
MDMYRWISHKTCAGTLARRSEAIFAYAPPLKSIFKNANATQRDDQTNNASGSAGESI